MLWTAGIWVLLSTLAMCKVMGKASPRRAWCTGVRWATATCAQLSSWGNTLRIEQGVAKVVAKASELYQRSEDGGDVVAAVRMGNVYQHGEGVPKNDAKACGAFLVCQGRRPCGV